MADLFAATLHWLAMPISGAAEHHIAPWAYWHARLMVLAWSILLPLGMLIARFFKVLPGQNWPNVLDRKVWWRSHIHLQSAGVLLMTLALAIVYGRGTGVTTVVRLHHLLGWGVVTIGWIQVLGGWLRGTKGGPTDSHLRGDHYDMTLRRVVFEYVHKHAGWLALPFAVLATAIGLLIVDAPRWMPIVIGGWWLLLVAAFVIFQRRGMCIDTYQAIWGPSDLHPGNRRRPIGWGVRTAASRGSQDAKITRDR